ncbi:secretoglobin family 1D member-like [Lynx canadensis]|uniref:Uteroglobin n=1 Tax=Lynx canadensis TaxID=61383 RepID=A0A667HTY8_LYNCA|nr:secretoglobin family 1D member-like [Lynx canadensis]XP_030188556.1 secretoglobin family 1D member-like [Lynx canadensis]XP_046926585.1 secretoglobin family 1D member-like [Lynx rufus]XP_046926891.1 secretoglobin family 1D member-like [Lynx rufus]XP_046926892.1 secretoglobin family 1D member-like [Lynx rufus]
MRLFLSVLLVTLAFCCYEANALPCPAFVADISGFLLTPTSVFKLSLAKYEAPPENVQAVLDVKSCTDNISKSRRKALTQILGKVTASCVI